MPGVSISFYLIIASIFLETTWKLESEFFSVACLSFKLFLKRDIFLPIICEPPDSYLILSKEWKLGCDSLLTSAEFAERLVGFSGITKARDWSSSTLLQSSSLVSSITTSFNVKTSSSSSISFYSEWVELYTFLCYESCLNPIYISK